VGINGDVGPGGDSRGDAIGIVCGRDPHEHGADHRRSERGDARGETGGAIGLLRLRIAHVRLKKSPDACGAFEANSFAGLIELHALRIAESKKRHRIGGLRHHVRRQPNDGVRVLAKGDLFTEAQAQFAVGDQFIVRLPQRPAGNDRQPLPFVAGPRKALDGGAQRSAAVLALDRMRHERIGTHHAGHGQYAILDVAMDIPSPRAVWWALLGGVIAIAFLSWVELQSKGSRHVEMAIADMTKGAQKQFFQGGLVFGMLLPAVLTIIALAIDIDTPIIVAVAGLSALFGMFLSETSFVRAGQSVPLS